MSERHCPPEWKARPNPHCQGRLRRYSRLSFALLSQGYRNEGYDCVMGNRRGMSRPRRDLLALVTAALTATLADAQVSDTPAPTRLPNGQLQSDAILKADYEQNVKDARELTALS